MSEALQAQRRWPLGEAAGENSGAAGLQLAAGDKWKKLRTLVQVSAGFRKVQELKDFEEGLRDLTDEIASEKEKIEVSRNLRSRETALRKEKYTDSLLRSSRKADSRKLCEK